MGLPTILINFRKLAETVVTRSERGIVAIILKDNSNTNMSYSFTSESEIVKSHFTANNLMYLNMVFLGSPSMVLVERITDNIQLEDALLRLKIKKWNYLTMPEASETDMVAFKKQNIDNEYIYLGCEVVLLPYQNHQKFILMGVIQ